MAEKTESILIGKEVIVKTKGELYASAVVEELISIGSIPDEDVYRVKFKDCTVSYYFVKDMIGTNYKPLTGLWMQPFQKVYTTHNGKEVSGYIQQYSDDQILISIPTASEEKEVISKKPAEVRLLDSRRNQRTPNNSPVNNSISPEDSSLLYGRTVSASIQVPKPSGRIRKTSEEPTMNELMAAMVLSSLSSSPIFHNQPKAESSPRSYDSSGVGSWTQDSKHTSPARHPISTNSVTADGKEQDFIDVESTSDTNRSRTPEDVLDTDSGTILLQRSTPTPTKTNVPESTKMEEDSYDEPQDLTMPKVVVEEASARPRSRSSQIPSSYSDVGKLDVVMEHEEQPKPQHSNPPVTMAMPIAIPPLPISYIVPPGYFQHSFLRSLPAEFHLLTTPPPVRSPDVGSSAPGVIDSKLHRYSHRAAPYHKFTDDSVAATSSGGSSPSTQHAYGSAPATYYQLPTSPIPVSSLSFSPSHHRKHTRSPLASKPSTSSHHTSPAKVTQSKPISVPPSSKPAGYPILPNMPFATAASERTVPKAFSWHETAAPNIFPKNAQPRQPLQPATSKTAYSVSPKSVPIGRKVRGDGKKCRKVYGMDHRDLWCTACRWKKACQRFPD